MDEQDDDVIAYFPEYKEQFDRIRRGLSLFITHLKSLLSDGEKLYKLDKKEFAENIKIYKYKDILFKAYGSDYWNLKEEFQADFLKNYVENIAISKLLDYVEEQLEDE